MLVLGIDTSSLVAGVGLCEDDRLIAEFNLNLKKTHSEKLMPLVIDLLDRAGYKPSDIDVFAVSTGPGSFTGLRIGVATVKGFALVLKKDIAALNTLDVLAYNLIGMDGYVCPILDARRGEVYTALYKMSDGDMERISDYRALPLIELTEELLKLEDAVTFLGDGVLTGRDTIINGMGSCAGFTGVQNLLQRGGSVALLGYERASKGDLTDVDKLIPFYLRESSAERIRKQKLHGEKL